MKKIWKCMGICLMLTVLVWFWACIRDRQYLNRELIRLHVVANSDSEENQVLKLQVRDAILDRLYADMANIGDVEAAKSYLRQNLPRIQQIANRTIAAAGVDAHAVATLCKEPFDTRFYDTFTLPAGVYESLRVVIGQGQGKNWWCVAFPTLCRGATTGEFEAAAQTAGMNDALTQTLSRKESYQIRFFLLDVLGSAETLIFRK